MKGVHCHIGEKNPMYGKKHTEETKEKIRLKRIGKPIPEEVKKKISLSTTGEKHHDWKPDDDLGYTALHRRVRKKKQKPEFCEFCHVRPPEDLANVTGIYNGQQKNWKDLCSKCHVNYDMRLLKAEIAKRVCVECGTNVTLIDEKQIPRWFKSKQLKGYLCHNCYRRELRRLSKCQQ